MTVMMTDKCENIIFGKEFESNSVVSVVAPTADQLLQLGDAVRILHDFAIPVEESIIAAHRAPRRTLRYVASLESKGVEVLIAGAAGSAFLPYLIASLTTNMPVIGVPLRGKALNGLDSLVSILQAGKGTPVATMGINSSYEAGLYACHILSIKYPHLTSKLAEFKAKQSVKKSEPKDSV